MSLTISELQRSILERSGVDVAPHYAEYQRRTGGNDVDGFVRYLRDQQVIGADVVATLQSSQGVEVTLLENPAAAAPYLPGAKNLPEVEGPEDEDDEPPRYEMLGLLGEGAMGAVHMARDIMLRRRVAMKSILPNMQQHRQVFSRFLGEMQITAQLDHPYIVPVYGLEVTDDGAVAYAMKLVSGKEFGDLLEETKEKIQAGHPLDGEHSLESRLEYFLKICDAISFAHDRGIVHRDLKPANIMIGSHKEVYVMDWGIARPIGKGGAAVDAGLELLDEEGDPVSTDRTRMGQALGTPIYMSPEQAAGRNTDLDGRSDLYTLGLILQEVITLQRAIGGTTLQEVITNAKQGRREPPARQANAAVPRELEAIIAKATALQPNDRYPGVAAFADDIRRYLRNDAVLAQPDTFFQGLARWVSKHRVESLAIMLGLLLAGAAGTIGVLAQAKAAEAAQHEKELRVSQLQTRSTLQAQAIDRELQRYESSLSKLVGAVSVALSHPLETEAKAFTAADYAGGSGPKDLTSSAHFGRPISVDHPVYSTAPGVSASAVEKEIAAMVGVRPRWKEALLEGYGVSVQKTGAEAQRQLITATGVPIERAFVTLASGLDVSYPGMKDARPEGDPRTVPAYELGEEKLGVHWRGPYTTPKGPRLAAAASIYDEGGTFRGVAGFEVDVARLFEKTNLEDIGFVDTTFLVARDGTVVARTGEPLAELGAVLPFDAVVDAMSRGESGVFQQDGKLITFNPLRTLPWYFVAVANLTTMLEEEAPPPPVAPWASGEAVPAISAPVVAPPPPPPPAPPEEDEDDEEEEPEPEPSATASASAAPPPVQRYPWPPPSAPPVAAPPPPPAEPPPAQPPPPPPPDMKNPFDRWEDKK